MQEFYIKKGAILPTLRIELIEDGRHSYNKFFELIQNSSITFTMVNRETGVTKVAKVPAYIKEREEALKSCNPEKRREFYPPLVQHFINTYYDNYEFLRYMLYLYNNI